MITYKRLREDNLMHLPHHSYSFSPKLKQVTRYTLQTFDL
ncbi:hypothetical protein VCHENC03_3712 [Vibrio sp. HENC-03]|nr:hypothetical protein VCHENC03_3712 [Vibrio sp. HENC-03]